MPSHSVEQAKTMSAIAHGWKPKGSAAGIPLKVAKEFHAADAGHKYGAKRADGGSVDDLGVGWTPSQQKRTDIGNEMIESRARNQRWQNQLKSIPNDGKWPEDQGRAFGGVAPMLSQAMNPVGVGMPQSMAGPPMSGASPLSRPLARGGSAVGVESPKKMTVGSLVSAVPGRTDLHKTHVPSGSYVIPADIVSAHGQGNTLAGMKHLHNFFRMGDSDTMSPNSAQIASKFARGGTTDKHVGKPVKVILAGGEIVVPPDKVMETMSRVAKKKLSLEDSHKAMDAWVLNNRKKLRRTLAKLKPPVKD